MRTLALVIAAGAIVGCVGTSSEWMLPSVEEDRETGREVAKQVDDQMGVVDHPSAFYLSRIGRRLSDRLEDRRPHGRAGARDALPR